ITCRREGRQLWSSTSDVAGARNVWPAATPDCTYTNTLARALAAPATTFSSVGVVGYFALHAASSLMSIAGFLGAAPVNLTFPVIVPPAAETSVLGGAACTALRSPLLHTVSRNIPPTTLKILPFIAASGMKSSAARATRPACPTPG